MNNNVETSVVENSKESRLTFTESVIVLAGISVVSLISNWAGTGVNPFQALPAMLIVYAMVIVGLVMAKYIPIGFPAVAWVSLVSVLVSTPISPIADPILNELKNLGFLAIVTPVLAYAAMAIAKEEVALFKKSGVKIAAVSILVFTGTYVGSVLVAGALL